MHLVYFMLHYNSIDKNVICKCYCENLVIYMNKVILYDVTFCSFYSIQTQIFHHSKIVIYEFYPFGNILIFCYSNRHSTHIY